MLLTVTRDDKRLAVLNTDHIQTVIWKDKVGSHNRWYVQLTHGRDMLILTPTGQGAGEPGVVVDGRNLIAALSIKP